MLADLFYLALCWLLPAFALLIVFGARWPRWLGSHYLISLLYLAFITGLGDAIALAWFKLPAGLVLLASLGLLALGLVLIYALRDWNALGQAFFIYSLVTTGLYLFYAFIITAFSALSPLAFLFSLALFILELCSLGLALSYAF